ncbi:activated Cdc42 kinase-like [Bradysia coprophila]|uniref:activated Cdc42 kinase-like n=1 Tax=Bradysia coprophila TaxID=38358 RepID=UPI00187DD397|nr:activated Cdc42 kinase-like [Bradysia coprophila]
MRIPSFYSSHWSHTHNLQSSISEESRDAYNRLVEKTSSQTMGRYDYDKNKLDSLDHFHDVVDVKLSSTTLPTQNPTFKHRHSVELKQATEFSVPTHPAPRPTTLPWRNSTGGDKRSPDVDSNPLRILRDKNYPIIRPRTKVNSTNDDAANRDSINNDAMCESPSYLTQPEYSFSEKDINLHRSSVQKQIAIKEIENFNPTPLPPPKDRSKILQTNVKRHVRKHPLIIHGTVLQRQLNKVKTPVEEKTPPFPLSSNSNYNTNSTKHAEVSKLRGFDHSYVNQEDLDGTNDKYYYTKKCTDYSRSYANITTLSCEVDCTDSASLDFESILESDVNKIDEMSSPEVVNGFVFDIQKDHVDDGLVDGRNLDRKKFEFSRKHPKNDQPKNELADNALFNKIKDQVEATINVDDDVDVAVRSGSKGIDTVDSAKEWRADESLSEGNLNDTNAVSCEDLLELSDKKPKGRERGLESDEVRIMTKVLGAVASADQFIIALNFIDWDVHKAIKIMMLQKTLADFNLTMERCVEALQQHDWDLQMTSLKLKGL